MIEYLEDKLTVAFKETSNTDNLEVAEEEIFDEAINEEAKDSNEI